MVERANGESRTDHVIPSGLSLPSPPGDKVWRDMIQIPRIGSWSLLRRKASRPCELEYIIPEWIHAPRRRQAHNNTETARFGRTHGFQY